LGSSDTHQHVLGPPQALSAGLRTETPGKKGVTFWDRASAQAPRCTPVPGSPVPVCAHVSIPLSYCCRANACRVLLAEKSPGELQRAHRGKEGIARQPEPGAHRAPTALGLSPTPGQGTCSAHGEGTAESLGLGWIRSSLRYCTRHLGTRRLVTVLYDVRKQLMVRAGSGAASGPWARRQWGRAPRSVGWLWSREPGSLAPCFPTH